MSRSRRQVLQGLGAGAVLLSGVLRAVRAEAAPPPRRAVFLCYANGSHYAWAPTGQGADFKLTPHLAPLEPIRDDVIICRDMACARGRGNPHKASTFSVLGAGAPTSFDQTLAAASKDHTPLASLELAIGFTSGGGGVAPSLSQVNGVFVPGERNPFAAYQRVASRVATDPRTRDTAAMAELLAARRSVLDFLGEEVVRFRGRLGARERPKADLLFDSVRELEKSLGKFAGALEEAPACGRMMPPVDTANFVARVSDLPKVSRLMLDVMALGLACDVTRVGSMMWGGGESDEPVEFMGLRDWHITTHGDPNGAAGQKVIQMQAYLAAEFTYFVQRLKTFSEGDGTLLDNTVVVFATQNGNTNQTNFAKEDHDRRNTPFVVAGRYGKSWKTGRVLDCGGVNHNDLYLSIAQAFGLEVTTVGDPEWCKGPLSGLA